MKKISLSVLAIAISGILTVNAQQQPKKDKKHHETIKEEVKEVKLKHEEKNAPQKELNKIKKEKRKEKKAENKAEPTNN